MTEREANLAGPSQLKKSRRESGEQITTVGLTPNLRQISDPTSKKAEAEAGMIAKRKQGLSHKL